MGIRDSEKHSAEKRPKSPIGLATGGTQEGEIKVAKVRAHPGEQTAAKGGADIRPTILNESADQLAGEGSARHETPPCGIHDPRQLDDTTRKTQRPSLIHTLPRRRKR